MTRSVIVVDDESIRRTLVRLLLAKGFVSKRFGSAEECRSALDVLDGPTCVIADLILPGISGHELLRQLPSHLTLIVFDKLRRRNTDGRLCWLGAVDLLEKPVALDARIQRLTIRERERRDGNGHHGPQ
ncbi:response regulator [Cupriavidus sp. SW-Y-13]|uniref:response regulator n=1 Tax=Cupriavidus sp. SW-Y-13 TaxID=2653854 RepID=UPI00136551F0|nr:response regulator [Cupriavidus sp. SW-Y-13]